MKLISYATVYVKYNICTHFNTLLNTIISSNSIFNSHIISYVLTFSIHFMCSICSKTTREISILIKYHKNFRENPRILSSWEQEFQVNHPLRPYPSHGTSLQIPLWESWKRMSAWWETSCCGEGPSSVRWLQGRHGQFQVCMQVLASTSYPG